MSLTLIPVYDIEKENCLHWENLRIWLRKAYFRGLLDFPLPSGLIKQTSFSLCRSSHRRCSIKKAFLKVLQNSQGSACAWVSFLIKLQPLACNLIKRATLAQVFSYEFTKFLRTTFLQNISFFLCIRINACWEKPRFPPNIQLGILVLNRYCMKSVRIWSFPSPFFFVFNPNAGKYGPE